MSEFDRWANEPGTYKGECCNCRVDGLVHDYARHDASPLIHLGKMMPLCYLCASTPGANAMEYPDQHPYHHGIVAPILGFISRAFYEMRKPKKPPKPRQPKLMHRRTK